MANVTVIVPATDPSDFRNGSATTTAELRSQVVFLQPTHLTKRRVHFSSKTLMELQKVL